MSKDLIGLYAGISGTDADKFYETIKKENKSKEWTVSPFMVSFEDGKILENSDAVLKLSNALYKKAEEVAKTGTIQEVKDFRSLAGNIETWLKGTRLNISREINLMIKKISEPEKEAEKAKDLLKKTEDELNELEYQKVEKVLREYISETQTKLKEDDNIEIDLDTIFSDFIARKRKTQALTTKGGIIKAVKDEVQTTVNEIVSKIKEERVLKEENERQMQSLTLDFNSIDCQAKPKEALAWLERLKLQVEIKYPNIKDMALSQIEANINIAKRVLEADEKQAEQREVVKEDNKFLKQATELYDNSSETDLEAIKSLGERIAEIRKKVRTLDPADAIDTMLNNLRVRYAEIKAKEVAEATKKSATITREDTTIPTQGKGAIKKWSISLEDVEVLTSITVECETEEEAKKELLEQFNFMINNMIKLIEEK